MIQGRAAAWAFVLYGIVGIVLVLSGALLGLGMADRIERLATAADDTLAAAARSTRAAADSFTSVDASLSEAQVSADGAAALSREASATLDALAVAMQLSLFGAQPLLPLADEFSTSSDQASELAGALDSVSTSLSDTRTDVATIGVELGTLSDEIEELQGTTDADEAAPPLRLFVALLLAWLAIPAIGSLLFGLALLRVARPAAPPAG